MRLTSMALIVLCIFAIVGGTVTSVALHEISHRYDFSSIEKNNEKLCLLNYPTDEAIGYYSFNATGQSSEINKIEKYTEFKSYSITVVIMALLIVCLIVGIFRFNELVKIEKKNNSY